MLSRCHIVFPKRSPFLGHNHARTWDPTYLLYLSQRSFINDLQTACPWLVDVNSTKLTPWFLLCWTILCSPILLWTMEMEKSWFGQAADGNPVSVAWPMVGSSWFLLPWCCCWCCFLSHHVRSTRLVHLLPSRDFICHPVRWTTGNCATILPWCKHSAAALWLVLLSKYHLHLLVFSGHCQIMTCWYYHYHCAICWSYRVL